MVSRRYGVVLLAAMSFACGCEESPAFPVPHGPPKRVALDVRLPTPVLGRWTEGTTAETLREELAKYNESGRKSTSGLAIRAAK